MQFAFLNDSQLKAGGKYTEIKNFHGKCLNADSLAQASTEYPQPEC